LREVCVRTRLLIGNWKMNKTASEAVVFVQQLSKLVDDLTGIEVGFAPPFTALPAVSATLGSRPAYLLGAQDLHWEDKGAYTGEISGAMLKDVGCTFVLVGHSERRHLFGETDAATNKKVAAALRYGLHPVLCIGEQLEEREGGFTDAVIERQLKTALAGLAPESLRSITIAYEPVWAIGTGRAASPEQAAEVHRQTRSILDHIGGPDCGERTRILYGGSVTPQNLASYLASTEVDGALVGGACLDPSSFATLVSVTKTAHNS
jgi:triosephosphate isomerase